MGRDKDIREGTRKAAIEAARNLLEVDVSLPTSDVFMMHNEPVGRRFWNSLKEICLIINEYLTDIQPLYNAQSGFQSDGSYIIGISDDIDDGLEALRAVTKRIAIRLQQECEQYMAGLNQWGEDASVICDDTYYHDGYPVYPPGVEGPRGPVAARAELTYEEFNEVRQAAHSLGAKLLDLPRKRQPRETNWIVGTRCDLTVAFGMSKNYPDYLEGFDRGMMLP